MQPRAVILLSGGLDSATTLAVAKQAGFAPYAMTFAYGQRQCVELRAAQAVAEAQGCVEHRFVHIDLRAIGGSALTSDVAVPKDRQPNAAAAEADSLPVTYVPARNTIFLSYALAWAEVLRAKHIFVGVNEVDYSGYPDCRPAFIAAFEQLANLATGVAVDHSARYSIEAPLMRMGKGEIIRTGLALGVDYGLTHSCYDPVDDLACGRCDACYLRRRGFSAAQVVDPTRYVQESRAS
ncbi:MAG: 7-cyano-7-deazaguanine synthase QueC [Deltaproteobacteria bacterium]|nr:MAG: 7-cyano-7-deazaguanine synthase QueC [Deltaproteobacteria bacterium]